MDIKKTLHNAKHYAKAGADKAIQFYHDHPEERQKIKEGLVTGSKNGFEAIKGFASGATNQAAHNMKALFLSQGKSLEDQRQTLETQRQRFADIIATGVAGFSIVDTYNALSRDPDVVKAYELANPDKAAETSLDQAISGMDEDGKLHFISELKGKLFEIKYVDYLNDGNLPAGFTAKLADSANQAGWDLQILDPLGNVADELQLKATNSVSYIQDALEKYPDIQIVSTEEVFAQANLHNLVDSGISNAELTEEVQRIVDPSFTDLDLLPGSLTVFLLGITTYFTEPDLGIFEKAQKTGAKYVDLIPGHIAGGAVFTVFGGIVGLVLGAAVSMATKVYVKKLIARAYVIDGMEKQIKANEAVIQRYSTT